MALGKKKFMFDEISQYARTLNQRCKQAARHVKDRLVPWRKKRREQIVHLGQQIQLLQEQLTQTQQILATTRQSIGFLENSRLDNEQMQALNALVHSGGPSAIQVAFEQCVERLTEQMEQLRSGHDASIEQLQQQQTLLQHQQRAVQQRWEQSSREVADVAQLARGIESRVFEMEQQTDRLSEFVYLSQSAVDSMQSKMEEIEQRSAVADSRLDAMISQLDQLNSPAPSDEPQTQVFADSVSEPEDEQSQVPALKCCSGACDEAPSQLTYKPSRPVSQAYDHYSRLQNTPFIYLDVKSVPRSGLHYLQRTLEGILGKSLSFCEWYQEPGCCKQMPCALTGFAQTACQQQSCGVRMVKSHDFDLDDPVFPVAGALRRIVLIRDPIFCLTSYWNLISLKHNQNLLSAHGIRLAKVDYLHEPAVLEMAYQLIDSHGLDPEEATLIQWLDDTRDYMLSFIAKWGRQVPAQSIVPYEKVNDWVLEWVESLAEYLSPAAAERFQTWKLHRNQNFMSRTSPFHSGSQRLSEYLARHAEPFQRCAETIRQADPTGWFSQCSVGHEIEFSRKSSEVEAETSCHFKIA